MDQYWINDLGDYRYKINEDEFKKLKEARKNLGFALVLEEKLEFLLMNYAEIEKEAFNITLSEMMSTDHNWNRTRDSINILNLKVFNFLSTHQFYEDSVKPILKSIYGKKSSEYKLIENKFSSEYNNPNLFYRTISMLRNHAQHCDLPINTMKQNYDLRDTNDGKQGKCSLQFFIKIASLEKNVRVNKNLLNDIENTFSEKIDLMFLIRNYLDSIGQIHQKIREILKPNLEKWDTIIMNTIENDHEKYKKYTEHHVLYVTKNLNFHDKDHRINISDCFNYIKRRKQLEKKYLYIKNYSRQFITNETLE